MQKREDLLDIVGSQSLENPPAGMGMNFTGIPNADYLQNLANLLQQQQEQEPQLGPDEFGSYSIPYSDPTYRSGFDYARSIAGGMPMSQVIAPGVSYSPEKPMGFTQEQLNIPKDVDIPPPPPAILPPTREFDIDLEKINKNLQYMSQKAKEAGITGTGGVDLTGESLRRVYDEGRGLFQNKVPTGRDFSIDREVLERPMISGLENRYFMDADSLITGVPTGRDFSIDREPIPPQDFGYGPGIMPPLPPMDIDKLIPPKINDQLFIDDRPIIDKRIVDRGYGPGIMPPLPPMDIINLPPVDLPPVDLPPINIPSRIPADLPPIVGFPPIRSIGKPNLNKFSIEQLPMGLFV